MAKKSKQLVDVLRKEATVLHTFAVTVESDDGEIIGVAEAKARQPAVYAGLANEVAPEDLDTRIHVQPSGQLQPYGDDRDIECESKEKLEQGVREHAYALWEQAGRPDGQSEEFWSRARHHHLSRRAYNLWQREGCPEGRADEFWSLTESFEAC